MIDLLLDLINSVFKHGWNWAATGAIVVAILKNRKAVLKILHRGQEHETQLDRIEHKIDALMSKEGVTWDADLKSGKNALNGINGIRARSLLQQVAYVPVTIARYFTPLKGTYHSQQRRMNMKSKLLSRKFLMALISAALVIANDGLNLGLDQNTIIAFGSIVVGWIIGETAVDVAKTKPEVSPYDAKTLDSVRADSEDTGYTASH